MTYKQKDARLKRGKLDGVNTHTLDKVEYAQRLMDKLANGEKMKPEGKHPKPRKPRDPYLDYEKGICSGCQEPLLKAPDGRTFHRAGVSSECRYGVADYHIERDLVNHSYIVTYGGVSTTYSMFDIIPVVSADMVEMDVPDWAFFDMEFV